MAKTKDLNERLGIRGTVSKFEVIVGGIGPVWYGDNKKEAEKQFELHKKRSQNAVGDWADRSVYLRTTLAEHLGFRDLRQKA